MCAETDGEDMLRLGGRVITDSKSPVSAADLLYCPHTRFCHRDQEIKCRAQVQSAKRGCYL